MTNSTLEWFGATTYRLRTRGVTIFLDTWLDRPSVLETYLPVDDVQEADYIFISHAHFDHLPGADRIAIKTGAIVIANNEAINLLREAGVPDHQLFPVQGGERIPLFTPLSVDVWPSLHCFMPADHPEVIDTATVYKGTASPYSCTLDITIGMKYGLFQLGELMPPEKLTPGHRSFIEYPKPDIAIMAIAGRANLNGRPFDGSAAEFAAMKVGWLGNPSQVIWCLHDEACIPPWRIHTEAATKSVEENGKTKILKMVHAQPVELNI
ncbi:hypothetical protein FGSG_10653 [Fusarium graminearum PH-1]|uniref:hypothetical protein n=1 Tax=Gibberella zeae (strain ATCC MYA-4620 / CBS 123657 / FGSC 9075 / NRRL 31084 / PH-1) TaxID=229533 RepID=UPI00021F12AB|nr:hypothetical protein FGSG_10653 [Fusarium graminearum PH-1]ESU17398.1 hypothetical protein FGSG_10653 [Fusarium graminearum PH-1]|eukprot:XP_011319660.1 hypothetical protein FGSG_10653 [Fusarium graminearum PH-1]